MRKYETVFISDPDLSDQARIDLFDKVRNIIASEKGILINLDEWGNKKLAYEIKKKLRGHYVCATYGGTGDLVKELERNFRLTDDVLKFMTIVLTEDMAAEDLEKEAQEVAQAIAAKPKEEAVEQEKTDETDAAEPETKEDTAAEEKIKEEEVKEEAAEETAEETEKTEKTEE